MKTIRVLVLNGANLHMLGEREPQYYGRYSWDNIRNKMEESVKHDDVELIFFQSNHEGELIDFLYKYSDQADLLIMNPGGFTHYSVSLRDAVSAVRIPMIEVHLSNIFAREPFRKISVFSDIARGLICGFQGESYLLALRAGLAMVKNSDEQN